MMLYMNVGVYSPMGIRLAEQAQSAEGAGAKYCVAVARGGECLSPAAPAPGLARAAARSSRSTRRAPHAHSPDVIVVRASTSSTAHQRLDARLNPVAESEDEDVIDLGAPRLLRRRAFEQRKPGLAVSVRARPLYIPNPRLYPGPQTKPKRRLKRTEGRGNDGRGRRHKRVFRRPVPNSRLYRPAPPRPPPPPAWPRTTWSPPAPSDRLETASRVALRVSEQRRGLHVLHRAVRTARSPVQAARSPVRAGRWPVRAALTPGRAARTPVRAARVPVRVAQSPVWPTRSPVQIAHSSVRTARSPARETRFPKRACRQQSPKSACASSLSVHQSSLSVTSPTRRLVVTLPAPPAEPVQHYRPTSEHFRLRSLDTDSGATTPVAGRPAARSPPHTRTPAAAPAMDTGNQHSTSPEDCSDGNETLSAPSEFLAEFLSAIMRRQYAEALKYCRLILQYEPHNTTARGFYPLLQHKVQAHKRTEGGWVRGSSSEEASAHADKPQHATAPGAQEMMEQGADESEGSAPASRGASRSSSRSRGSCASQSSLELDSSEALAHSSPSLSLSRRTDHTDSASAGCWESSGSASRSEPDDNGNAPAATAIPACAADVQNDNAVSSAAAPHKTDSPASLRRLRAQFTCSIK